MLPAERLATSVSRVTSTMLGLTFRPTIDTTRPALWRTAMLNIPGVRPVTVAMSSDRQGCAALAAAMLGMDEDELDCAMIDDFLRELVNMTAGQIKSELSLDQALGLPRVMDGEPMYEAPGVWTHFVLHANSISLVISLTAALVRSIITKTLTELGFEIEQAEDGEQALAKLEEISVDLILLDVTMPVMDGPTMLEKLRAGGNKTPVIMLTSESKRSIVSGAVKLGIEDYILKPFKPDELRGKVMKALKMDGTAPSAPSASASVNASPAAAPARANSAPPAGRQFIDVLVIDDMENVHKKLRGMIPDTLSMNGCCSAREALQFSQERVYRVVLVDLVIPDVNSVALMNQLRVLQPHAVMIALALRTSNDIAAEVKGQGFHDVMFKPFDAGALDDWRVKYFDVKDILSINDNVLSCAEFVGKQERLDGYFARLKALCHESFEKLASACYEDSILDLSQVPLHNDRLPRLVLEMDSEAKKFGISLRLVGHPDAKKALNALVETASLPFFATIVEAKSATA